jgi:hypothetical protein
LAVNSLYPSLKEKPGRRSGRPGNQLGDLVTDEEYNA